MRHSTSTIGQRTLRVFAYLDEELSGSARAMFEKDMATDPDLTHEVRAWEALFGVLGELPTFAPSEDFIVSVMAALKAQPTSRAAFRSWLLGRAPAPSRGVLDRLTEGSLEPAASEALAAFVAENADVRSALTRWNHVHASLATLDHLRPSPAFADNVMARVQVPVTKPTMAARLLRKLSQLWPERKQKLAVASGVAFGPTAVVATLAYMVFSNPLTTPATLLNYVATKGLAGVATVVSNGFSVVLQSDVFRGVYQAFGSAPLTGAGISAGVVLFCLTTLASAWVLYQHLVRLPAMEQQHVAT